MAKAGAIAAALLAMLAARPAGAYVRYTHALTGAPYYWAEGCAPITIHLNGFTQMTPNQVAAATAAAADTWSPERVSCAGGDAGSTHPYLEIVTSLATGGPVPAVGDDARNSLIFRTERWSYDPTALAITTVFARGDGHITDADIEVNAFHVPNAGTWANYDPAANLCRNGQDVFDLQYILTHEFGHFQGLDHTCFFPGDLDGKAHPLDDQGRPIPPCAGAPDEITSAVMFAHQEPCNITKRALSPDEIRASCDIYAPTAEPKLCALDVPNDGCGTAGAARPGLLGAVAILLALARARRRR